MLQHALHALAGPVQPRAITGHSHPPQVRVLLNAEPAAALERLHDGDAGALATPLYLASLEGHGATVRQLLAAAPQAAGMLAGVLTLKTPLHAAVGEGHLDVVRFVLEAAPHTALIATSDDHLPIHLAAVAYQHASSAAMVQLLLAAAPDPATHALGGGGFAPLHFAAMGGNAAAAHLLLQAAPGGAERALETALLKVSAEDDGDAPRYLDTARAILAAVPPDVSLPMLVHEADVALPLFTDVATHWPLTAAQWQQVPSPCPGLGRALPAVMQRSETEAAALVAHLPPSDSARLRAFALALRRAQRRLHIHLPGEIVCRMLSLFDS